MRRSRRRWLVAGVVIAAVTATGTFTLAAPKYYPSAPTRIVIQATPIQSFDNADPTRTRFGLLDFRGGLVLTSPAKTFGGLSALHVARDGGRFVALTDRGAWLTGRIVYRNGRPVAISDAVMAPVLGPDGRPLPARGWYDTEALAADGGTYYVGIERVERVVRFDFGRDGVRARGRPIPVPGDFKSFTNNKGVECLAVAPANTAPAGALIAITERSLDNAGNHRGFLLKGAQVGRFSVKRSDGFDVSDCAVLPPGDLLLLERRYSILSGVAMRIRRIPLASIKPGATIDGRVLIAADLAQQIDNMEGIAVHRDARGQAVITLVSDDNFNDALQRNLLLQFVLVGE